MPQPRQPLVLREVAVLGLRIQILLELRAIQMIASGPPRGSIVIEGVHVSLDDPLEDTLIETKTEQP